MLALTFSLTIAGYLASALLFYLALVRSPSEQSNLTLGQRLLTATAAIHLGDIAVRSVVLHTCPVLSAAFALSVAALVATVGFLVWSRLGRLRSLGVIIAPISLGMFVASQMLMRHGNAPDVPGWFLALHVLANLSAVALFVLAAAASIAYLFEDGRLRSKRFNVRRFTLPGLSSLESLIQRSLALGLGPMTLGVVSGAVFAERLSRGGVESARITLAYACWLVVATLVVGQRLVGWSGRRVAWGAIVAAGIAVAVVVMYTMASGGHAG